MLSERRSPVDGRPCATRLAELFDGDMPKRGEFGALRPTSLLFRRRGSVGGRTTGVREGVKKYSFCGSSGNVADEDDMVLGRSLGLEGAEADGVRLSTSGSASALALAEVEES